MLLAQTFLIYSKQMNISICRTDNGGVIMSKSPLESFTYEIFPG